MKRLLVILGPTATGKTDTALYLAKKFSGELVSCDSRQVYVGLDIGTGKLPSGIWNMEYGRWKKGKGWWEIDGVKIWMYDVVNPLVQYNVASYVQNAVKVVRGIRERGELPIIVGGAGLYLKALINGLPSLSIPVDKKLRRKLEQLTVSQLQERLKENSAERWERMNYSDRQNPRRLIRAIEILKSSKLKYQNLNVQLKSQNVNVLKIGLIAKKEILHRRSDERVIRRIKQGMIEEAERLVKDGVSLYRMRQLGLEYGVLADFLEGKIKTRKELIKILQGRIHGYIKRQLTWFNNPSASSGYINWFDIENKKTPDKIENLVRKWYDSF